MIEHDESTAALAQRAKETGGPLHLLARRPVDPLANSRIMDDAERLDRIVLTVAEESGAAVLDIFESRSVSRRYRCHHSSTAAAKSFARVLEAAHRRFHGARGPAGFIVGIR